MPAKGETKHNPDKLIDTWQFVYDALIDPTKRAGVEEEEEDEKAVDENETPKEGTMVGEKRVEVQVYMKKVLRMAAKPPHPPNSVNFVVKCRQPNLQMEGTDLEALRAAMFGALQQEFAIKWENFYLVEISQGYHASYGESAILFSYKDVERGTAHDGTLLMRRYESRSRGDNWRISKWPGRFTNRQGKVIACIPASPENRAAMEEFGKRIQALRAKLSQLLEPDMIMQTLAAMSGNDFLLPAPEKVIADASADDGE